MVYSIQFLRFVAASMVALHHAIAFSGKNLTEYRAEFSHVAEMGASGVHVFFVISGFVMVWTQAEKFGNARPFDFLRRRIARIYPLYWLLALTGIPLILLTPRVLINTPSDWLGALLLWPEQSSALISVGWTLSYELFFYAVFAGVLALQLSMVASLRVLTGLFAVLVVLGQVLEPAPQTGLFVATNSLLVEFVAGAWIARVILADPPFGAGIGWLCTVIGVAGLCLSIVTGYETLPTVVIWGIPSVFLVFGVVLLERQGIGLALYHKTQELGDASYALYLLHAIWMPLVMLFAFQDVALTPVTIFGVMALLYLSSLWLSLILHRHVEKPLVAVANRLLRGGAPALRAKGS